MSVGMYGGKFLPLHMGHVYAITKAASMVDELYVVLTYSKTRDEKLCEGKIKSIPHSIRLRWLLGVTKDMENVKVVAVEDEAETDKEYDWEKGADDIKEAIGKKIDCVFSSEHTYTSIFSTLYPTAEHIVIDSKREKYPISATKIRNEGVFKHWAYIPNVVREYFVKKVMIVGTESCGKSTLTRYLAKLYNTSYVEEYGRKLCEEIGGCEDVMTEEDFQIIAYGHKIKEKEAVKKANKVVFIDTEAIVTQYYSKLYLNNHQPVLDQIAQLQQYDLWIYLEPDVKWVDDGLRVHGEREVRENNNKKLKEMLRGRGIEFYTIEGNYNKRLEKAIKLIDELLDVK